MSITNKIENLNKSSLSGLSNRLKKLLDDSQKINTSSSPSTNNQSNSGLTTEQFIEQLKRSKRSSI